MEVLQQQTLTLQQERDQTLTSFQQHQHQTEQLTKEVERLKEREVKLTRENDRLRSHLIQVEEGYTREALESEEREKELRNRVAIAEEKLVSASYNVETSSHQLTLQIEELKYQLQVVSSQRDAAYSQVTSMQDQCQQYASSLANLQLVLEQFQQGTSNEQSGFFNKDNQIATESEKYQEELEMLKKQYNDTQLEEASEGLEAAARLSVQLDKKEEAIQALRDEVVLREKSLKQAEEEIKKLSSSTEAKVDKELMKNLLLGYFTTPQKKRNEVVHTIGGVLNFNPEEFDKISAAEGSGGWVPGLFKFGRSTGPTPPATPVKSGSKAPSFNQSFSQLFVKFLETESTPPPPPVRLPAEQMAQELQQKHREKDHTKPPTFNPFTAPRHVAMPINLDGNKSKATDSHILMASSNTPSFTPMFTMPASTENISQSSSGRSTPSNSSSAILKNVLETR
ncbi:hypothetical protein LOTGIDRAFT_115668 [Lottia gigantea]|uniref:GRIP domain-containing protein n=1 Tax=Lottia gigantea TaxID=225164 RepID=V4C4H7_LOTGI|nr:hypothetical protein LOTGIDRAFT_115668 [Lottia gigantea]ESO96444.1 hypothetical protein LOTGIDRAFT_115668 [Lottia gigantea]